MLRKTRTVGFLLIASLTLTAFSSPSSAVARRAGLPWWGWLLVFLAIVLLALLIWWCLGRRRARQTDALRDVTPPVAETAPSEAAELDDLKVVEGIGPKVASLLNGAAITTFAQLASTEVGQLEEILEQAGLQMMDPASWPEQAALAAAGKREELTALQDALKGGRRV